ncbi:membrane protein insertase YidC [Pedobacter sp. P351]|uniref:membrane protein insertase YidC n=1 Tax=Pedobacter superstes TaxID=3133441 RepID=UPI003094C31C
MDRNTFTGLFLILVILVGSMYLLQPSEQEVKREKFVQDSIAQSKSAKPAAKTQTPAASAAIVPVVDSTILKGPFGAAHSGSDQKVTLENEHLIVIIGSKGGGIESVELKEHKTYQNKPLIMFNANQTNFGLTFNAAGSAINTSTLYFSPSLQKLSVSKSDSGSVTMRLAYSQNQFIDYIYSLKGDSYKVGLTIVTSGLQSVLPQGQHINLNWSATLTQKEKDLESERTRYSGAYFKYDDNEPKHIGLDKDEKKELGEEGKVRWVSFKQHFFSNVLIAKNGFDKVNLSVVNSTEPGVLKTITANMQLPVNSQNNNIYPLEFFFGPNKFKILNDQGYDLEQQIDLGWGPLKWINRYAVLPIFNSLERFNWSYGLIILALTIILKVALTPLTYKSYLSMAKMRVLKPEMEEIKTKVGEDNPTLLQQEYMKLYKKAGVNPLGGCIPMLLQMPIIMAFFFFFPNLFELRHQSFLWMGDLSTYDSIISFPRIPLIGINHISLMCLLMTISTLIYTYYNNQISGATGQMKYIGYITPIIFFGVLNSYPAGLNYYYFLANMLTFAQQFIIKQFVNDEKIHSQIQENKKKPNADKKSKFQQRMEDYMRQKQAPAKELPAKPAVKAPKKK